MLVKLKKQNMIISIKEPHLYFMVKLFFVNRDIAEYLTYLLFFSQDAMQVLLCSIYCALLISLRSLNNNSKNICQKLILDTYIDKTVINGAVIYIRFSVIQTNLLVQFL